MFLRSCVEQLVLGFNEHLLKIYKSIISRVTVDVLNFLIVCNSIMKVLPKRKLMKLTGCN